MQQLESIPPIQSQLPAGVITAIKEAVTDADIPRARTIVSPHGLASETLSRLFKVDSTALALQLEKEAEELNGGRLSGLEGTLASQATTLNAMFHRLCQVACAEPRSLEEFAGYMKLALRSQAQSAGALEILANLKQGPKVVITRQLNAAHQQVVNNHRDDEGVPTSPKARIVRSAKKVSRARANTLPAFLLPPNQSPNPLEYATMDTRSPRETASVDSKLAAVDWVHRPNQPGRKREKLPERR